MKAVSALTCNHCGDLFITSKSTFLAGVLCIGCESIALFNRLLIAEDRANRMEMKVNEMAANLAHTTSMLYTKADLPPIAPKPPITDKPATIGADW